MASVSASLVAGPAKVVTTTAGVISGLPTQTVTKLQEKFTDMKKEIEESNTAVTVAVGTAVSVSSTLSLSYVIWFLRGGSLLTSLLTNLPAWQFFDPLPVLDSWEGGGGGDSSKDDEDEAEKRLRDMMK